MKKTTFLVLFSASIFSFYALAEDTLPTRRRAKPIEKPSKPITPSNESEAAFSQPKLLRTSVQWEAVTPLVQEIFPETRFRAFGNILSGSFYLTQLGESAVLRLTPGLGFTLIRLSLSQPAIEFSHLFILFPVRLSVLYELNSKVFLEAFLGALFRPWENDSRQPPDGGFHKTETGFTTFDGGANVGLFLSENIFGRLSLGIQFLSLGFGIVL